ncbi:MAG: hypothetical protein ACOZDY_18510 [Pseudomonadota bacterium]
MPVVFVVAGAVLIGAALTILPDRAQARDPWRHVGKIGMMDLVVVDAEQELNKDVYRLAIGKVCAGREFCKVLIWADERMVPKTMPMTDAQVRALRANWTYNGRTGSRTMLWSCDIDPDPSSCFR